MDADPARRAGRGAGRGRCEPHRRSERRKGRSRRQRKNPMTSTGPNPPASASRSAPTSALTSERRGAPVLELEHVSLELGDRTILRDTGFVVNQGEFIGVLGPNGAGKTTLMRAVLGLVPAAQGAIRVLGRPVERGNASIGYMPQTRSALAGRRVRGRDFVAMAADGHRWGLPHADAHTRAD